MCGVCYLLVVAKLFPAASAHQCPYSAKHWKKSQESVCVDEAVHRKMIKKSQPIIKSTFCVGPHSGGMPERMGQLSIKPSTMAYQLLPKCINLSSDPPLVPSTCAVAQTSTLY